MNNSNSLVKRLLAAAAAGTLLFAVPMSGCNFGDKDKEKENSKASTASGDASADEKTDNGVVAKSPHYSIPFSVFEYLYNYNYTTFVSTYGSSMLDGSKGLDEQYYDETNKITWHDYFLQSTQDYITYIMCFGEGGLDNGMALTDAEKKEVEEGFASLEETAKESSQTLDEYIKSVYGDKVTKADIENVQSISKVGLKYGNKLHDGYKFTDKEYEDKFAEKKTSYQVADYYQYTFSFAETSEDGTSTTVDEKKKNEMKENAAALANSKSGKEFNDYLTKYLKANPSAVPVSSTGTETSLTEDEFNNNVNSYVESAFHSKAAYDESSDMTKWLFDASRKANETKVFENDNDYTVVLVSKPLYRDESGTRNIRHILITTENIQTGENSGDTVDDSKVKEYADKVLEEWKSKDSTQDRFAELANKYIKDPGSNTNGGLYSNVVEGQMVPAFNDWLFDKNRKPGDTGIVKTDYGYHIMYYVGSGLKSWQINVDTVLRDEKLAEDYNNLKTKYPVEFDTEAIKKAQVKKTDEESSASGAANLAQQ